MAILYDASGDRITRASAFDHNAAYTWAGWVMRTVNDSTHHILAYVDSGTNYNSCDEIVLEWFTGRVGMYIDNSGTNLGIVYSTTSPTINTYYHIAMVRETTTSIKLYINGTLAVTTTTSVATRPSATRMSMADLPAGGQPPTGIVTAAWNLWTRALTGAELTSQMAQAAPTDATNLWAEWLMQSGGTRGDDASGNARHWTSNGTLTDVADPSITYPSGAAASMSIRQGPRMPMALLAR